MSISRGAKLPEAYSKRFPAIIETNYVFTVYFNSIWLNTNACYTC